MNFIEDVVQGFPFSQEAVITVDADGRREVHYFSHLFTRSLGLSGAMLEQGVRRGDVVMLLVGSRIEWVISMLACFRMGAVALPCNPQLTAADLTKRVAATDPALAIGEDRYLAGLPDGVPYLDMRDLERIFDEDLAQATPAASARLGADDPALIVFTSGSTGDPKGVVHSQRYLFGQATQAEHWLGARPGELVWCTAAPGWSKSSRNSFIAPWLTGAKSLLVDDRFDPDTRLGIVRDQGVNVLCQAPTEFRILARRTELAPTPSVRRMVSAGESLNPEVIDAFRLATGLEIADGYGQTETGAVTGVRPGDPLQGREGSMGRPLPGIETRIVDEELQVRVKTSPTFFSNYLDGTSFDEEWWPTGDLVVADREGFLYHQGRNDDLISSAGYRIGPVEVESVLLTHPAVAEAAVVAAPDPERGSVVKAVVVLRDRYEGRVGTDAGSAETDDSLVAELQQHCREATAPYKYPRLIEFVPELPKTPSGKIKRAELRAKEE
ncbi:MAG: AMP-binding protein [Solirubrobacterales bacterium]|nr:AMP-binding protein [Solirubrobacterales bacterium]